ncbi:hypothetical protein MESS2_p140016 [Mesorhizobium metallidurans STM 2683]|uniref:RES domain-containing protein n=1 Tax=Mesorhizobium metallidurans STM 2683 TaxID=1297569 RepID=M5EZ61_9HYPH|nr:RES domain-containing protein [Mesorhizobium metallidurans]CCV09472.1 hypothetical protein MESS2_p140016 [Mesorhizobium metallidurans STM 2683]
MGGALGPDDIFHRYLAPKWAILPTSGAGAAIDGGRFNRPGIKALYLSHSTQAALEEYKQGASIVPRQRLPPTSRLQADVGTLCGIVFEGRKIAVVLVGIRARPAPADSWRDRG